MYDFWKFIGSGKYGDMVNQAKNVAEQQKIAKTCKGYIKRWK
jgi:hypothetical protein